MTEKQIAVIVGAGPGLGNALVRRYGIVPAFSTFRTNSSNGHGVPAASADFLSVGKLSG